MHTKTVPAHQLRIGHIIVPASGEQRIVTMARIQGARAEVVLRFDQIAGEHRVHPTTVFCVLADHN